MALVIGNSDYAESPLRNPANDAADMAQKLSELGFDVQQHTNVNRQSMRMAIREFGHKLKRAEVGLFYFAGHGVQIEGVNYLVPLGTDISSADEVQDESINASAVLRKMESAGNKVNIVILDACRNNPFPRSFRSAERGLARMDGPVGSFIAYATAPGAVAADGDGRNGLYTQYLLSALDRPGLSIEQVFKQVRNRVVQDTSGKQTPWESSSLMGEFVFAATNRVATVTPALAIPPVQPIMTGHIQVISNVPQAEVVINRVQRGQVDGDGVLNVSRVQGKTAQLTVTAEGYLPYTQEVELVANQWQQVNVTLRSIQKKCYQGKNVVLEAQIELLGAEPLTLIQQNQMQSLLRDALIRNQLNVVAPGKQGDYKIRAIISADEIPVSVLKTSFKTADIAIALELTDAVTGTTLAQVNKEYRRAGTSAEDILHQILASEMVGMVRRVLAKGCI